jgi:hypothetical protein
LLPIGNFNLLGKRDFVGHMRPNVGHERRLEACEARWKASARWKS